MRAFCPVFSLLAVHSTVYVSHCSLNFICCIFLVLTRARRLSRTDSQAGEGFTCPMRMRAFPLSLAYLVGFSGLIARARRLLRTDSQAGGGFTCPLRMRAFCLVLLSSCCSLYMYLTAVCVTYLLDLLGAYSRWEGISHALTARQEEVLPVQCSCAPFVPYCSLLAVHSLCISLLFA
jgi:hypothetical protein